MIDSHGVSYAESIHVQSLVANPAKPDASRKPFRGGDLYLHWKITEPEGSPTQGCVACSVRSVDRANDTYHTKLWFYTLADATCSAGVQLTQGPGNDHSPRWLPDGSQIAFVSDGAGTAQIHLLGTGSAAETSGGNSGEARQLRAGDAPAELVLSPNRAMAFWAKALQHAGLDAAQRIVSG